MIFGIYIFRRDLRLEDNYGLINLARKCDIIIPIFILDKNQIIKNEHNKNYFSNNAVEFMCASLEDLNNQLDGKLKLFFGYPDKILEYIISKIDDDIIVGWNQDYSKYSIKRDNKLIKVCKEFDIETLITNTDNTLIPMSDNKMYKQFSAFYKNSILTKPSMPLKNKFNNYYNKKFDKEYNIKNLSDFYQKNKNIAQIGGRNETLKIFKTFKKFDEYNDLRDRLDYETTNISAALNFGCVSIRESYYAFLKALGKNSGLLKQLYWRDFYLQIIKHIPNDFKHFIDDRYNHIAWKNKKKDWEILMEGKTGFLLVDAGMQQMKITGYLHNRLRMILGYFWAKYLLINPLHPIYGSQVNFSKYLVDAVGPSQNFMNHLWIVDLDYAGRRYAPKGVPLAGRPMDVSNKMIKKFDPDCVYIKRWLPHLKDVSNKELYNWKGSKNKIDGEHRGLHPGPIFDAKEKYLEWIQICKI
jgi:deoxyribodipyrimidine photo-lyase